MSERELTAEQRLSLAEFLRGLDVGKLRIEKVLIALMDLEPVPLVNGQPREVCVRCGADLSVRPVLSTVAAPGVARLAEASADLELLERAQKTAGKDEADDLVRWRSERIASLRTEVERLRRVTSKSGPTSNRRIRKKPVQLVFEERIEGALGSREALEQLPRFGFRLCGVCAVRGTDSSGAPDRRIPLAVEVERLRDRVSLLEQHLRQAENIIARHPDAGARLAAMQFRKALDPEGP